MKTLSFNICSGILFKRSDAQDVKDAKKLGILPIDCVVVNFYPFEEAVARGDAGLIEQVDIGGPTLVRAAAKNSQDVLCLSDPNEYASVISELDSNGRVSAETRHKQAAIAWSQVARYDSAIEQELGSGTKIVLKYGENPHQKASARVLADSPIAWDESASALSYNNILDFSAAFELAAEFKQAFKNHSGVVIVKHGNPCGAVVIPSATVGVAEAQRQALAKAWEGDPVSAFGSVLCFTDSLENLAVEWLGEKFVEGIASPTPNESPILSQYRLKRKLLKTVRIKSFEQRPNQTKLLLSGIELTQDCDQGLREGDLEMRSVTLEKFPKALVGLAQFGVLLCRALKSNAVAIVREIVGGGFQLIGAGQGQPNRVEAIKALALPRAQTVLRDSGGKLEQCVFVSDAFFPFRDSIDLLHSACVKFVVQPGGSKKDQESIDAANEHGMAMAFTGRRHFRH